MALVVNLKGTTDAILERTETLKRYFDDIKHYETLTKEEEKALFDVYRNGNPKESKMAKDKLINSNQRFVVAVAKRYGTKENVLDLIEEGNLALLEALECFDPEKDVKFTSWAVWYIRRAINIYNVNYGSIVRKNNQAKTYHLISKATNEFVQKEHRQPTNDELFEILNEKYDANLKSSMDVIPTKINSIDEEYGTDDDVTNLGDMALYNSYSASSNGYEKNIKDDYIHNMISSLLNVLTPREQTVIKMAYGIGYYREFENHEIAEKVGLTTERVRQMKSSIVERLGKEYKNRISKLK